MNHVEYENAQREMELGERKSKLLSEILEVLVRERAGICKAIEGLEEALPLMRTSDK